MWLAEFQISAQSRVKKNQTMSVTWLDKLWKSNNDLVGTVGIDLLESLIIDVLHWKIIWNPDLAQEAQ